MFFQNLGWRLSSLVLIAITTFNSTQTLAAIPPQQIEFEVQSIQVVQPLPQTFDHADIARIIPTDMKATNRSEDVERKIFDQSVQALISGETFRQSQLGQTASKIEDAMKTEIVLGHSADGENHSINLEVRPFQNEAILKYTGTLDANITYRMDTQSTDINLSETLNNSTRMVLNHRSSSATSHLLLQWDF